MITAKHDTSFIILTIADPSYQLTLMSSAHKGQSYQVDLASPFKQFQRSSVSYPAHPLSYL